MNWIRVFIRLAISFVVLYIMGYVVPGFSGLTVPLLLGISAIIALISAVVENTTHPESTRARAVTLFLISTGVIYIYTLAVAGRPPVVSTILAALLVAMVDLVYPEKAPHAKAE